MHHHVATIKTNLIIFGLLMLLLVATVGAAELPLGPLNFPVAMLIATTKTVLIIFYFMHLTGTDKLTKTIVGTMFLWLVLMILMIMMDYLSRDWLQILGK